jgi:hypothetical protein
LATLPILTFFYTLEESPCAGKKESWKAWK